MVSHAAAKRSADPGAEMTELVATGAAFLIVDGQGDVRRASGWREMLGEPAPPRLPAEGAGSGELFEAMAEAAEESRRLGAVVRRYVSVSLERRRNYAVFAGPVPGPGRAASIAILVSEITDAYQAGPQEGETIRELGHDLRTPLTSMSGAVEILQMGRLGTLSPEQAKLVGMLQQGIDLMLSLIDQATTPYRMAAARATGGVSGTMPGDGMLR